MTALPVAVLDACVLANFSLCDTLLRLAEPPALYEPKWSEEIMMETLGTLEFKLGWPLSLISHFDTELRRNFDGAWIRGHESLVSSMTNDDKDRHVAAAATHAGADYIVTFNLRHFAPVHLSHFGVLALHPQAFLIGLYELHPKAVITKLHQQAEDRGRPLSRLFEILHATVPAFVEHLRASER
ncbi:MAG: PIN domain-containing protein [Bryobacteraceae bacterium]